MAYSYGTPSIVTQTGPDGREYYLITISETEAASGSEWVVTGLPKVGRLLLYKATRTAGTGTTINPILGSAASFSASTQNHIATNATTAAHINDATSLPLALPTGTLYGLSTPNSAVADHTISTLMVIAAGTEA